ncbi:hypothetical protein H0H92_002043, partial [Tricholoma furcatifolium]
HPMSRSARPKNPSSKLVDPTNIAEPRIASHRNSIAAAAAAKQSEDNASTATAEIEQASITGVTAATTLGSATPLGLDSPSPLTVPSVGPSVETQVEQASGPIKRKA